MTDFTPFKKEMTYRMALAYCKGEHGCDDLCEECLNRLMSAMKHLDNCRFKEEGRPCPSCPDCCFHGSDLENMLKTVTYESKHPELASEVGTDRAIRGFDDISETVRKYNARFDKTKATIQKAFLDLLEDHKYGDISVSMICKKAGISRDTFYYHYKTKMDLTDDCVFDFTYRTDFMPSQAKYSRWDNEPVGEPMCLLLRKSKAYQNLFYDSEVGDHCIELMISCSAPHLLHSFMGRSDASTEQILNVNRMAILGCMNMIRINLDKSDEEWLKIKESIDRFNLGGLRLLTWD